MSEICKLCTTCETLKPVSGFHKIRKGLYGVRSVCKECRKVEGSVKYSKDKDKMLAQRRMYYRANKKHCSTVGKLYRSRKYQSDPMYRLQVKLAGYIRKALNGSNLYSNKTKAYQIIGLDGRSLREHLMNSFESKYGFKLEKVSRDVEVDHIIPKSTAKTLEDVFRLNHYTNLRLLTREDNQRKRNG